MAEHDALRDAADLFHTLKQLLVIDNNGWLKPVLKVDA